MDTDTRRNELWALTHEDTVYYHIPRSVHIPDDANVRDEHGPIDERFPGNWFAVVGRNSTTLMVIPSVRQRVVRYTCKVTAPEYPDTIDAADWDSYYRDRPDFDVFEALYERVTEPYTPDRILIDLTLAVRLEGAPALDHDDGRISPGRPWQATIPTELRQHAELAHLFPGKFHDFPKAAVEALDADPRLSAYDDRGGSGIKVYANVPFPTDLANHPAVAKRNRGRETITVELKYKLPYYIQGRNRAEAVEAWNAEIGKVRASIDEFFGHTCPTCRGAGRVAEPPAAAE